MTVNAIRIKQLFLGSIVTGALALTGCASTGSSLLGNSDASSADPRLTQGTDASFFNKSGLQACAGGAAVGVMSCMLSNSSNQTQCAIIAGLSACGVAMGANYYLEQRRNEYASTEERLAVMSQDIQQDTQKVIARTNTARQVMEADRRSITRIEQEIAEQRLNKESAEKELAGIDSNIAILRRDIRNMKNSVQEYEEVVALEREDASPVEIQQVEQEIQVMNQQVVALQQEVDDLYGMRSAITLG